MSVLLAVGTRKGLWLYRSDDRRTWTVDGPHFAHAGGRLGRVRHPARHAAASSSGVMSWHWGPDHRVVRRPRGDLERDRERARSRSPTTPTPRSAGSGRSSPTPPTGRTSCGRAASRPRCGAATTAARPSRSCAGSGTTRTARSGRPGSAARRCTPSLPDPTSDRVTVAMSTGGVYVSDDGATGWTPRNTRHPREVHARPVPRVRPVRAQGRRRRRGPVSACTRRTTTASTAATTAVCSGRRSPTACPATSASSSSPRRHRRAPRGSCRWRPTSSGIPVDGRMRVHRTRDAGCHLDGARPGPPRRRAGPSCCAMRPASTPTEPTGVYLGTRDGCVYASADEGDTYALVADHLPDVLSVRATLVLTVGVTLRLPAALADAAGGQRGSTSTPRRPRSWATSSTRVAALPPRARTPGARRDRRAAPVRQRLRRRRRRAAPRRPGHRRCATAPRSRCCRRSPAADRPVTLIDPGERGGVPTRAR